MAGVLYLDASALVKLVLREHESEALTELLSRWPRRASSTVAKVEVPRAVRRVGAPGTEELLTEIWDTTEIVALDEAVIDRASRIAPLKTLDAIHLASALALGTQLGAFVVYDRRLQVAAANAGVPVLAPG